MLVDITEEVINVVITNFNSNSYTNYRWGQASSRWGSSSSGSTDDVFLL